MTWGSALRSAVSAVASAGRDVAATMQSAATAAAAAAHRAAQTAIATAVTGAKATAAKGQALAIQGYQATARTAAAAKDLAVDVSRRGVAITKAATAASVAVSGAVGAAAGGSSALAAAGLYNTVRERFSDKQPALLPLTQCASVQGESAQARKERILKRQALIAKGKNDPATREAAERLERDMHSVELARLSANVYTQYDPNDRNPLPKPWKALAPDELAQLGIDPLNMADAKAMVYGVPDDFPFEPKVIVAFRGTTGAAEDILVDHDNALGRKSRQYTASMQLGESLRHLKPTPMVTGHSLGGGKAQAAVVAAGGSVKGQMFNSVGLHPAVLNESPEVLAQFSSLCDQQRTVGGISVGGGDPLTGMQLSPAIQKVVYGAVSAIGSVSNAMRGGFAALGVEAQNIEPAHNEASLTAALFKRISSVTAQEAAANKARYGWYVPPSLGQERTQTVASKNPDGTDTGLLNQHSIVNMINGYESRKIDDVQALAQAAKSQEPVSNLIGPTR